MPSFVLSLALALLGFAGGSAGVTNKPGDCGPGASCTGTLEGTVTLAGAGAPVGATVFLQPLSHPYPPSQGDYVLRDDTVRATQRGQFHGLVAAGGKVTIRQVPPGAYIPVIQVPGYISPESYPSIPQRGTPGPAGARQSDHTVVVSAGKVTTFHLQLHHGGTIAGVARSADGRPAHRDGPLVQQVALSLLLKRADGCFAHAGGLGAAHTDAAGRFTFSDLPPGDYVVMTALPAPAVSTEGGQQSVNGGLVFSGSTSRLGEASVIHVRGTETKQTELVLPTGGLRNVSGRVLAPDGSPLTQGLVRIQPMGDSPSASIPPLSSIATPIRKDGSFQFSSLLPDRYELWLQTQSEITMVGFTDDHHGIRMRATPSPYLSPRLPVDLLTPAAEPVVLQLKAAGERAPATR